MSETTNKEMQVTMLEIIEKAREYQETKSVRTAADVCDMLNEYADKYLTRNED